jgi:hypothetical protein
MKYKQYTTVHTLGRAATSLAWWSNMQSNVVFVDLCCFRSKQNHIHTHM